MLTKIRAEVSPIGVMVDQFLEYCDKSRGMAYATIKTRKTHLTQFSRYCAERGLFDVSMLSPAFMDDYFSYYQNTHSKNTANTGRRIMKVFLKWIIGYKELSTVQPNTIQLVRTSKPLPQALNIKDVVRVISESKTQQDALIIGILLESGIRIGELIKIRVEDVIGNSIMIHGKGSIDRIVYISEKLALKIHSFIQDTNREQYDYLIQNIYKGYGQKMSIGTARLRIQKEFQKHDIEMHPHQLRHTFAITLLKNGCDIVTIQRLLGHSDVKTTQVYLNVTNDYLREQHKAFMFFE